MNTAPQNMFFPSSRGPSGKIPRQWRHAADRWRIMRNAAGRVTWPYGARWRHKKVLHQCLYQETIVSQDLFNARLERWKKPRTVIALELMSLYNCPTCLPQMWKSVSTVVRGRHDVPNMTPWMPHKPNFIAPIYSQFGRSLSNHNNDVWYNWLCSRELSSKKIQKYIPEQVGQSPPPK